MKTRFDSNEATELERKIINHYRLNDPNTGFLDGCEDDTRHCLQENVNAYLAESEHYHDISDPEQVELMRMFLLIAQADINGQYTYRPQDVDLVVKALNTFGL